MKANPLMRPLNNEVGSKLNFYINLTSQVKGTKERLRRLSQSALALKDKGNSALKMRSVMQSGAAGLEFIISIVSCLVVILGLFKAAHSEQPLLWLAVWPIPVTLACVTFIFVREGLHFQDGVLVLGRR